MEEFGPVPEKQPEGTYEDPIITGKMSPEEAIYSVRYKHPGVNESILKRQRLVDIKYLNSLDRKVYQGQIVVDEALVPDIEALSEYTTKTRKGVLKIDKIIPIVAYEWDDEASMEDNNSSGYSHRNIEGTDRLSLHAFGFAVDINPRDNPVMVNGVVSEPENGLYAKNDLNTLAPDNEIVLFLKNRGFEWGGDWDSPKDYHHFQKVIPTREYINYYLKNVITDPKVNPETVVKIVEGILDNITKKNIKEEYAPNLLELVKNSKVASLIGKERYEKFFNDINKIIHDAKVRP